MIKQYGADSVRWFILSDSPPEKDVQWSDAGVVSSNKFLQKIWNLNNIIIKRVDQKGEREIVESFDADIDLLVSKIDKTIEEFRFNVSIALFYETYNLFNKSLNLKITNDCLLTNMTKIMKLLIPFTPHLAYECLELLNCKDVDYWPKIRTNLQEKIKFAIQINVKTRDIISVKRDLEKNEINILVKNNLKISKFFSNKEILKTIFVKNKIINYIIK